jgi:hypothetical protein
MKRPYFIWDQVPDSQSGSGKLIQRSLSQPPASVPYASNLTPLARQSSDMLPAARESSSDIEI